MEWLRFLSWAITESGGKVGPGHSPHWDESLLVSDHKEAQHSTEQIRARMLAKQDSMNRSERGRLVQVVKQQAVLATRALDRSGAAALLEGYIYAIPICISFRGRPGRAGCAGFFHGQGEGDVGRIVINAGVCYTEKRFTATLFHELAHAINFWVNGPSCDSHGPKWAAIMRQLGQKPSRCHDYTDRV
jgi:hypothetical protein